METSFTRTMMNSLLCMSNERYLFSLLTLPREISTAKHYVSCPKEKNRQLCRGKMSLLLHYNQVYTCSTCRFHILVFAPSPAPHVVPWCTKRRVVPLEKADIKMCPNVNGIDCPNHSVLRDSVLFTLIGTPQLAADSQASSDEHAPP